MTILQIRSFTYNLLIFFVCIKIKLEEFTVDQQLEWVQFLWDFLLYQYLEV